MVITKARLNQQIEDLQRLVADGYASHDPADMLHEVWATLTNAASSLNDTAQELHRHAAPCRVNSVRTRMVPIGPLFNRFRRLIRDICRTTDKEAELIVDGEHTELDKRLIDELSDPLTHLIRNSIDHGLEEKSDRQAAGKSAIGRVSYVPCIEAVRFMLRLKMMVVGWTQTKLLPMLDRGLTTESELQTLSGKDIYSFIFSPGFSTAAAVSDISGRGVGMDIVHPKLLKI